MGNKIDANTRLATLEHDILTLSGLDVDKDIEIYDVPIGDDNYIHTICCGHTNKEVIVLVHGYAGTGILYFKMLKALSEKYKVYCIDLLGMGLSSRPKFNCTNGQESINFFTDSIEKWRSAVGLEKFILAGHSFGGHITCHYTHKYPENVTKLFLISPLGFTNHKEGEPKLSMPKPSFVTKILLRWKDKFFADQVTMSHVVNKMWYIKVFMKTIIKKRLNESSEIGDMLYEYLMEVYKKPESSDKALFLIMNKEFQAHNPLEEIIEEIHDIPVMVFFGYKDWMDDVGAQRLAQKKENQYNYELFYIKDAGHQIFMENPKELLEYILRVEEVIEFS